MAIVASGAYTLYLARHDPALLKRRAEAGISYEREPAQKIIVFFLFVVCTALVVIPPLDFRFGWSSIVVRLNSWRRARSVLVLRLLSGIKGEHIRCRQCPR
jgi:hypothetical protein